MDLHHLFDLDDRPTYNTQAVVRMTGVHAPRLRAWERRYAFVKPHRHTNKYRLYSQRDVAIICWLRDQVDAGIAISQATTMLRALQIDQPVPSIELVPIISPEPLTVQPASSHHLAEKLVEAALQLDQKIAQEILSAAFGMYTVEDVCIYVMVPALHIIGEIWQEAPENIIVEHFLSGIIRVQLESLLHAAPMIQLGQTVLVGNVPGEMHEIGALMTALFLRRAGLSVVYLGQNLDARGLIAVAKAHVPVVVCLSITMQSFVSSSQRLLQELSHIQNVRVFVGGPAILRDQVKILPPHVIPLPQNLRQTVEILRKALLT